MELAKFIVGEHDPNCTCCPACDEAAARLLADPFNPALRLAVAGRPVFRTTARRPDARGQQTGVPDPPSLEAAIRAAQAERNDPSIRTARIRAAFGLPASDEPISPAPQPTNAAAPPPPDIAALIRERRAK